MSSNENVYKWPTDWEEFGEELKQKWQVSILQERRSLVGKSRAKVILVEIILPDYSGLAILKLVVDGNETEENEFDRHCIAENLDPDFAIKHLPKTVKSFRKDNRIAYLMTVAGDGLNYTTSFFDLSANKQYIAAENVSCALLTKWNRSACLGKSGVNSKLVIDAWLKHRIGNNSNLPDLLQGLFDISPDTPSFRLYGRDWPNPYIFAKGEFPGVSNILITPIIGRFHGDLHGFNLLIGDMEGIKKDFYIIDLASFENGLPLFFDHAYLEFSLLLHERGKIGYEPYIDIIEALVNIESPNKIPQNLKNLEDHGLFTTIARSRHMITVWINDHHKHRKQDMTNQLLLARIAVGLNYANKRSLDDDTERSEKLKVFAFLYAAINLKKFLDFNSISYPVDGPVAKLERDNPLPASSWREVWNYCDGFNSSRNAYILIAGNELRNLPDESKKTLGRIPWSLILDFDHKGDDGGLMAHARPILAKQRGFHLLLPDQVEHVNFNQGVCWLMTAGWHERPDSIPASAQIWNRSVPQKIRELAKTLKSATVPRPIYMQVMTKGLGKDRLRRTVEAFDEILGDQLRTIVIIDNDEDTSFDTLSDSIAKCKDVRCKYTNLTLGLQQMLGDEQSTASIRIPYRDQISGELASLIIDPAEGALFSETIEIVHNGLTNIEYLSDGEEVADFLHGNTITWKELDLNADVEREVTFNILKAIRELLDSSRTVSYKLEHTPGAGGTTVARRVVWTLKNEFPAVLLKNYTEATSNHIEALFHRSNLPIFIVVEQSRLSNVQRDRFFNELKSRSIRFVILDVVRHQNPRDTEHSCALADPMSTMEARRFLGKYAERCHDTRRKELEKLINNDMRDFRSAFFFGFFAFLEEFQYIPLYVRAHLTQLTPIARQTLAYLALISRYSPERLPAASFCIIADRSSDAMVRIGEWFGEAAKNLIMFDGKVVAIIHPLIAQEILKSELQPENATHENAWLAKLTDFCINFIQLMGKPEHRDSEEIKAILAQLFIDRKTWEETGPVRGLFSELINKIPNPEGQNRVLKQLCEEFPQSAVFLNHLGRHFCHRLNSYAEAANCFQQAIQIEPKDDVHHHGLGMVYRFDIKSRFTSYDKAYLGEAWLTEIRPLFDKAEICFLKSYELDPAKGQYPLVTHIQLINETIEKLFQFWKSQVPEHERHYQVFFNQVDAISAWCREKIADAEDLLSELKHLQANASLSRHTVECEGKIKEYFGDPSFMIDGLSKLLERDDMLKPPLRRMLAYTYIRKSEQTHTEINTKTNRKILTLMSENIKNDPANGVDIRLWFKVFRKLPEFSMIEAIERMTNLAYQADSIDAYYYLYILHFINGRQGVQNSLNESKKYLEMCRRKAPVLLSKKSFEWWASNDLGWSCPLVHEREIGEWDKQKDFFERTEKLGYVEGVIDEIKFNQQGTIIVNGMAAFFVPRGKFPVGTRNRKVRFYLGFRYEGLHAWNVEPIE